MKQSTRLIVNTGATYVRMAVSIGIGLAYTRAAIHLLGSDGYGAFGVIIATLLVVFTAGESLGYASDRFLAYGIGKNDATEQRAVYATLQVLFLCVAAFGLVAAVGAAAVFGSIAENIPPERLNAARAALLLQAVGSAVLTAGTPFRSALASRQEIALLTVFELVDAAGRLVAALVAGRVARALGADPLPTLVGLLLVAQLVSISGVAALALGRYPDTRPRLGLASWRAARSILGFTGWSLVGGLAIRVRMQGPQFVFANAFFPVTNAAMSVAQQVAGMQNNLGQAIMRAVSPALTTAEGRGDRAQVRQLIHAGNKFSLLMIFLFLAPICLEMPVLLRLWLGPDAPPEAADFARLAMLASAVNSGASGYLIAVHAHGMLRGFMLSMLACEGAALVFAIGLVQFAGAPAVVVPACGLAGVGMTCVAVVVIASKNLGLPKRDWLTRTWLPVTKAVGPALGAALVPRLLMADGLVRLVATAGTFWLVACPMVWFFGLEREERFHLARIARGVLGRVGVRVPGGAVSVGPPA